MWDHFNIGSLLLWKGKAENFEALACEPIYGYDGNGDRSLIVLDGQQRLTAMYYAFCAPDIKAPGRVGRYLYFIRVDRFMEEVYDEAFTYDWTQRGLNLLEDKEAQFKEHVFPLAIVGQPGWALAEWVQAYKGYWDEQAKLAYDQGDTEYEEIARRYYDNANEFGQHLKEITEQYQIAFIELDEDIEIDKVCDIFTQINSKGIRLDIFDLINALLKPKGLQLKHMWRNAKEKLDFVDPDKHRMNVYILQVMSILLQNYCSPKYLYYLIPEQERTFREPDRSLRKETLVKDIADFERRWNDAVEAVRKAIILLRDPREFGAIKSNYLPYVSILPVFSALNTRALQLPSNRQLDAQRKLRLWYWSSVFTNRYSGSVEATNASDFIAVQAWLKNDNAEPGMISEFRSRFRDLDLAGATKQGTSIYNGIFNLLVLEGARDWRTGNVPRYDDLDDHHIVPKSWGKESNLQVSIDTILNRTLLTSETNRNVINNRLPNSYLPELIAENGEELVRRTLESHFISPTGFEILMRQPFREVDFQDFIRDRQKTLKDAIEDLIIKERLDLSPRLRELDARIEDIELGLRDKIVQGLDNDGSQLPSHVREKVEKRIQNAVKKHPEHGEEYFRELPKKLEYCDFREIQDTITNKTLWPVFHPYFNSKEELIMRFDRIIELRNGIRHSRAVGEVVQKDGEASILWFEKILSAKKLN